MKKYLLSPHKRYEIAKGNYWLVKGGLNECWRFIKDKYFFCIHFMYDPQLLLKTVSNEDVLDHARIEKFVYESDICFGILTKRGNASVKSMLKVYKLESEYEAHIQLSSEKQVQAEDDDEDAPLKGNFNLAKKINCKGAIINGVNTLALMSRMELYVDEYKWKNVDKNT